jgi:hypothetical protein
MSTIILPAARVYILMYEVWLLIMPWKKLFLIFQSFRFRNSVESRTEKSNIDYDWIMGEPVKVLITKRQSPLMVDFNGRLSQSPFQLFYFAVRMCVGLVGKSTLMGEKTFVIAIWAGVSSTTPSLLPPVLNACYAGYIRAYHVSVSDSVRLAYVIELPFCIRATPKPVLLLSHWISRLSDRL